MPDLTPAQLLTLAADVVAVGALRSEPVYRGGEEIGDWIAADRGDFSVVHETHQRSIRVYRGHQLLREFPMSYAAGHEGQAREIAEAMVRRVNLQETPVMERA